MKINKKVSAYKTLVGYLIAEILLIILFISSGKSISKSILDILTLIFMVAKKYSLLGDKNIKFLFALETL
jgi:hypothetical protein